MRVAFWGNFGTLNLGNECTLAAAVANVRTHLPDAELVAICRVPEDTARRHGIAAIAISGAGNAGKTRRCPRPFQMLCHVVRELRAWTRALRELGSIDVVLITGCGILSDHGEGTLGFPYELFKWSLATRLRGKKLLYVSVGAESIARPLARLFLKAALRLANYRCYRDRHSANLLQAIGFDTGHDVVRPDLAFSLPVGIPVTDVADGAPDAAARRRGVAVGLYNYRGRGQGGPENAAAYQGYLDSLASLILWLLGHGYLVRVIIGDLAYDEDVRLDLRAVLAARGMELDDPWFIDAPATSFEQLLEQLAVIDFVIASRYHNVILALLLEKPVLSISYEAKNEALMIGMGLGAYCQTLDDFRLERLLQQFEELERNGDTLRLMIRERAAAHRVALEVQYDVIVSNAWQPPAR